MTQIKLPPKNPGRFSHGLLQMLGIYSYPSGGRILLKCGWVNIESIMALISSNNDSISPARTPLNEKLSCCEEKSTFRE